MLGFRCSFRWISEGIREFDFVFINDDAADKCLDDIPLCVGIRNGALGLGGPAQCAHELLSADSRSEEIFLHASFATLAFK